jgi:hypothetical protein
MVFDAQSWALDLRSVDRGIDFQLDARHAGMLLAVSESAISGDGLEVIGAVEAAALEAAKLLGLLEVRTDELDAPV